MSTNDDYFAFEEIVSGLGSLVGQDEIEARKFLGDEKYEKTVALIETTNMLMLRRDVTHIKCLEANSFLMNSSALAIFMASLLGVAWSIYFWIR